jgi:hypothetical protein
MENNPFKHSGEVNQTVQPEYQQVQNDLHPDEHLHRIDHRIVGRSCRGGGGSEAIVLVAILVIVALIMVVLVVVGGIYLFAPRLLGGL